MKAEKGGEGKPMKLGKAKETTDREVKCHECHQPLEERELERHMRARHALYFAGVRRWLRGGDEKIRSLEFAVKESSHSNRTSVSIKIKRKAA